MNRALVVLAVLLAPSVAAADISHVIFMDRCADGCQISASGNDSSITNESGTPLNNGVTGVSTVSPWRWGDALWNELVDCVREVYAPYDVTVTDVDPAPAFHHEVVVAGYATEVGFTPQNSPGGIASRSAGCDPKDNGLSYVFANATSSIPYLCAAVAQESAHSFGLLDHIYDCTDPMTYLALGGQCGPKFFRNKLMPCGTSDPILCVCGGARVNSHVQILQVFGKGADPEPPVASLVAPLDGGTIDADTNLSIDASDRRGIAQIDVFFNGWPWGHYTQPESITPPFTWPTSFVIEPDAGFPDGVIDIEVRVSNDLDVSTVVDATVTKGSPCTSADTCLAGQRCDDGRCLWDAPTGQLGDACSFDEFCEGPNTYDGVCGTVDDLSMCTHACFSGPNDNCPDGFACRPDNGTSGAGVCWVPPPEETCGDCSGGGGGQTPVLLGIAVGAFVLRRRRR